MKATALLLFFAAASLFAGETLDIALKDIKGDESTLRDHEGKVMLVVNVASECGLTPQYTQLQAVYKKYADQGFTVLGFPCNQFGKQEPGSDAEVLQFCSSKYAVTFPMYSKIEVNGDSAHPLYKAMKKEAGPDKIRWNFEKFLLDGKGKVIKRFSPRTKPDSPELISAIEGALKK